MRKPKQKIPQKYRGTKLAKYLQSNRYRKFATSPLKRKSNLLQFKRLYIALGIIFFLIGLYFTIF